MIPPDDDSKQAATGCEVDLKTRAIRFLDCEDQEAMVSAAEKRVTALTSMIVERNGFTNRQRQGMNRERNFLRKWRSDWPWQDKSTTLAIEKHLRGPAAARAPVLISFQPDGKWGYQVVL